ncbi:MAG: DUF3307 domain-containing protein [Rikenellaceae bacterium]
MITLLLQMILAHIISDFILQTNQIKDGKSGSLKKQKRSKYWYQIIHALTHAVVTYIVIGDWNSFVIPLVIMITHFVVDYIKCRKQNDKLSAFIIDQIAHLALIFAVCWYFCSDFSIDLSSVGDFFNNTRALKILIAYSLILKPTSVLLLLFFKRWNIDTDGLQDAGCWIGYIERILILTFVITNHIEAVGFLLAAKSVFRFGDLKQSNEIKITEYVLIGTLTSFTIAIILGLAVNL